jgi:hypothetical protein
VFRSLREERPAFVLRGSNFRSRYGFKTNVPFPLDDVGGGFGAVMVVDDDRRAALGELFGDGSAEAARTAGDEGDAPQQRLRGSRIGFAGTSLRFHIPDLGLSEVVPALFALI